MDQMTASPLQSALYELARAVAAPKCHPCGCLASTLDTLDRSGVEVPEVQNAISAARKVLKPRKYECLGCEVCYPAVAANAFSDAFPNAVLEGALCPTDAPAERDGWPPLPGEYTVLRYMAPVAVCTLNSSDLARELAVRRPEGLAIVGTVHTENLGIERVIRNVLGGSCCVATIPVSSSGTCPGRAWQASSRTASTTSSASSGPRASGRS